MGRPGLREFDPVARDKVIIRTLTIAPAETIG
jgi:hypothetical protein